MNSVSVSTQVVFLLKRLANVVGAFGISNQYLLHRQAKADQQRVKGPDDVTGTTVPPGTVTWLTLAGLKDVEWLSWPTSGDWRRARNAIVNKWTTACRDIRAEGLLRADTSSLPWLERTMSWPFVFSLQVNPNPNQEDDPQPPAERRNVKKQDQDPFKLTPAHEQKLAQLPPDLIHQLLASPALYNPLRKPRSPIVLCHGLYGFDTRGPASFPSMRLEYWSNVLKVLRDKLGAEVIVTSVPGTGSVASRAARLDEQLKTKVRGRGINLLAHSMGGLDSRYLITHIQPTEYSPLSLMTVSTPHRGSPFMDWCVDNIGIGKLNQQERELALALERGSPPNCPVAPPPDEVKPKSESPSSISLSSLPSSFTTLLLSIVDSPAYANLTTEFLNRVFNPATPDDPNVKYFSVASRLSSMSIWHPLWFTKMVLDEAERKQRLKSKELWERRRDEGGMAGKSEDDEEVPFWAQEREWGNDGLVTIQSAKWGEFLGTLEGCDHWEMRGARSFEIDLPSLNFTLSPSGSHSWSILDWSRFVQAWKREERIERDANLQGAAKNITVTTSPTAQQTRKPSGRDQNNTNVDNDAVLKASTEKLSTVFDWLIDQIPESAKSVTSSVSMNVPLKAPEKVVEAANEMMHELAKKVKDRNEREQEETKETKANGSEKKNELETKEDLERFYVALSRKMYDEGL